MSIFTFAVEEIDEIPEIKNSRPTSVHPFPWDDAEITLKAGKRAKFVVPNAYWTEVRGQAVEKVTASYTREKVRAAFKTWQARDPGRAAVVIHLQTAPDGVEVYLERLSETAATPDVPPIQDTAAKVKKS